MSCSRFSNFGGGGVVGGGGGGSVGGGGGGGVFFFSFGFFHVLFVVRHSGGI